MMSRFLGLLGLLVLVASPALAQSPVSTTLYFDIPAGATVELNGERTTISRAEPKVVLEGLQRQKYKYRVTMRWKSGARELSTVDDLTFEAGTPHRISLYVGRLIIEPIGRAPALNYTHAVRPKQTPGDTNPGQRELRGTRPASRDTRLLDELALDGLLAAQQQGKNLLDLNQIAEGRRKIEEGLELVRTSVPHHKTIVQSIDEGLPGIASGDGIAEKFLRANRLADDVRELLAVEVKKNEAARAIERQLLSEARRREREVAEQLLAAIIEAERRRQAQANNPFINPKPPTGNPIDINTIGGRPIGTESGSVFSSYLVYRRTAAVIVGDSQVATLEQGEVIDAVDEVVLNGQLWVKMDKTISKQRVTGWVNISQLCPVSPLSIDGLHLLPHPDGDRLELRMSQAFAQRLNGILQRINEDQLAEVTKFVSEVAIKVICVALAVKVSGGMLTKVMLEVADQLATLVCQVLIEVIRDDFKNFKAQFQTASGTGDVTVSLYTRRFPLSTDALVAASAEQFRKLWESLQDLRPEDRIRLQAQTGYYATMLTFVKNMAVGGVVGAKWSVQNIGYE